MYIICIFRFENEFAPQELHLPHTFKVETLQVDEETGHTEVPQLTYACYVLGHVVQIFFFPPTAPAADLSIGDEAQPPFVLRMQLCLWRCRLDVRKLEDGGRARGLLMHPWH